MGGRGGASSGVTLAHRTEDRIVEATKALAAAYPGSHVRLAALRQRLTAFGKEDVDKALVRLAKAHKITLTPDDDQKNLTSADRAAAIRFGDRLNHLISVPS